MLKLEEGPDSNPSESHDGGSLTVDATLLLVALVCRSVRTGELSASWSVCTGIERFCLLKVRSETLEVQLSGSESSESAGCRLAGVLLRVDLLVTLWDSSRTGPPDLTSTGGSTVAPPTSGGCAPELSEPVVLLVLRGVPQPGFDAAEEQDSTSEMSLS